jgi:hypothetical protein
MFTATNAIVGQGTIYGFNSGKVPVVPVSIEKKMKFQDFDRMKQPTVQTMGFSSKKRKAGL